jgi:hypothetical protein
MVIHINDFIVLGIILIFIFVPFVRFAISHFFQICVWAVIDGYYYIKRKRWNECPYYGRIWITTAHKNKVFGSGKTLDITMCVRDIYKKYNNLDVWDVEKNCFVKQHIHIISNVELADVPYTKFVSAAQFKTVEQEEQDVTIFLFDEIGAIWNSRNYKDNISTPLLQELLQCRKNKIMIIGSSQRFKFVDALLRQITGLVTCVSKTWRIIKRIEYDPYELENCNNPELLKPLNISYKFVYNKDYAAYDTRAKVDDLMKLDMLPDSEILANQGLIESELAQSTGLKKKYRKRVRR